MFTNKLVSMIFFGKKNWGPKFSIYGKKSMHALQDEKANVT
jgi:hypothetical protein